jgi:predicted Zn-dependent protease
VEVAVARAAAGALALIAACAAPPRATSCIGDERCMAAAADRETMQTYFEYDDPELAAYVASVGERLARAAGDHRRWTFRVLDRSEVQAESNVGTIIYITRGAIARLRDEAELAGVLAHEIGHVLAGHARAWVIERARDLRQGTATLQDKRDDEIQADDLSVLLLARAGYDPHAVVTLQRALAAGDPDVDPATYEDPHPAIVERLARLEAFASRFHGGDRRAAEFRAHVRDLVVGHDPRNTAVVGGALVLARIGLAIDLPAGWKSALLNDTGVAVKYDHELVVYFRITRPGVDTARDAETVVSRGRQVELFPDGNPTPAGLAAELRARVRPVRVDELARIPPPAHLALDAPRTLWPDDGPVPPSSFDVVLAE